MKLQTKLLLTAVAGIACVGIPSQWFQQRQNAVLVDALNSRNRTCADTGAGFSGMAEVRTVVTRLDEVTEQNAANAEESAHAASDPTQEAEAMHTAIANLRELLDGSPSSTTAPRPATHPASPSTAAGASLLRGHNPLTINCIPFDFPAESRRSVTPPPPRRA